MTSSHLRSTASSPTIRRPLSCAPDSYPSTRPQPRHPSRYEPLLPDPASSAPYNHRILLLICRAKQPIVAPSAPIRR